MSDTASTEVATAEPVVVENKAEVPNTTPPAEEKVGSSKLLDFAKKEAALVKKEVEYKAKLAAAEKELEDLKYFRSAKEHYKENPISLLEKLGIGYDDLTNAVIDYYDKEKSSPKVPSVDEIKKQVMDELTAKQQEFIQKQEAAVIESFTKEISEFVKTSGEEFPYLTKLYQPLGQTETPEELIFEVIENYFQETGEVLDIKTAAATAEEYFRDEWAKLNGDLSGKPQSEPASQNVQPPQSSPQKEVVTNEARALVEDKTGNVSANAFKFRDFAVSNNTKYVTPYRAKIDRSSREDVINRAVAALETASKRK